MKRNRLFRSAGLTLFFLFGLQLPALAHVKWFSAFSFAHQPLSLQQILSPVFLMMLAACLCIIGALVFLDDQITRHPAYKQFVDKVSIHANRSDLIIRVATGAVLLLSWQSGALLVPELLVYNAWAEFAQLTLAILILSNRFTHYAGIGLICVYLFSVFYFGALHMLDYTYLLGAGYYLATTNSSNKKRRASALPALYASVGFSLCWVSLEKLVYPDWGIEILQANPALTFGFDLAVFLQIAAFVEFILGFLLIVCLLQRPIALAITGLFISTTLVFGKLEFVGHAIVHAALIVFLLRGPGITFRTPITFFKHIWQRITFAVLSFGIVFMAMLLIYTNAAEATYITAQETAAQTVHLASLQEVATDQPQPRLALDVHEDMHGGWNVRLITQNFEFTPEECGQGHIDGHGHAHLYLNGEKIARLYSPWYHINSLPKGKHDFKVVLTSNEHAEYAINGIPLSVEKSVVAM